MLCHDFGEFSPGRAPKLRGTPSCGTCSILYSNVHSLRQAFGELCKTCLLYHPFFVCLTETHLSGDPVDSICPPGYVMAAHRDRTKHGGGVLILARDSCLFDEIDTTAVTIPGTTELVAIAYHDCLLLLPALST